MADTPLPAALRSRVEAIMRAVEVYDTPIHEDVRGAVEALARDLAAANEAVIGAGFAVRHARDDADRLAVSLRELCLALRSQKGRISIRVSVNLRNAEAALAVHGGEA